MARQPISEYTGKKILSEVFEGNFSGLQIKYPDLSPLKKLDPKLRYVVKVDQGVKRRLKQGLLFLDVSYKDLKPKIESLYKLGYQQFMIEEYRKHDQTQELYLSLTRVREGFRLLFANQGGVDIESNPGSLQSHIIKSAKSHVKLPLPSKLLEKMCETMDELHISFIEINPLLRISITRYIPLDVAMEVDTAGQYFVRNAWTEIDYVFPNRTALTIQEQTVRQLADQSQASFSLQVLNPNGSLGMLLSGGGASIVLADEVYDQGYGNQLINYGEYSGNPNAAETELYTDQIIQLLLNSTAPQKVLVIAGGVANFTDVRVTFQGVIKSLEKHYRQLQKQHIKVYVRRGGPFQQQGLQMMADFLQKHQLYGQVSGPEINLTDIITAALSKLKS